MIQTLVIALFFLASPLAHADLMNGLVGWYKMDEGSGTTSTADSSNNGYTGTLTGHAPSWVTGKKHFGLSFDGTGTQYISISNSLGLSGSNTNISVAGWSYRLALNDHGAFFKIGNNTDFTGGDGVAIGIAAAGASGFETAGNNIVALYEGVRWIDTSVTATTGWHHFALVINSTGGPAVYWDGVLIYSDAGAAPAAIGSLGASITQIGGYTSSSPSNRFFTGYLDDMRIYNRALSATEVNDIYLQGLGRIIYGKNSVISASKTSY